MTLQSFTTQVPLYAPSRQLFLTTVGSTLTFQLNGAGDKIGFIFIAPRSETIDCAAFKTTVVTTGAANAITVSLETVDATNGRPTGTLVGGSASALVTTTTATPTTYEVTGLGAALTAGTAYALTLTWAAGDQLIALGLGSTAGMFPYYFTFDGTTNTKGIVDLVMVCLGTGTSAYVDIPGFYGPFTAALTSFTDAGNPDEVGIIFNIPFKATLAGLLMPNTIGASVYSFKAYSAPTTGPTLLTSMTISADNDIRQATAAGYTQWLFPATADLAVNTDYAVTLRAGTVGTFQYLGLTYTNAQHLKCMAGATLGYLVGRQNDTGNFTATTTVIPSIIPLFSKLDDGAGGTPAGGARYMRIAA